MQKRIIALLVVFLMIFGMIETAAASNFAPDPAGSMPSEQLNAQFTTANITVDGVRDEAYNTAVPSKIGHTKNAAANGDVVSATYGELRAVWDGPVLYLLVEVHDKTKSRGTLADIGLQQNTANNPALRDSVVFGLDFWNDKVDKFQDDDGLFTISSNGNLTYQLNAGVNNHSSVHAYPQNREYTNRIKSYAASETADGYTVELALQIEGAKLKNGTSFGVEVAISDSPSEGASRTGYVFWSHNNNAYAALSQDHSVDWGTVTLAGWNGTAPFKFSDWQLRDTIRWVDSNSLVKGVWTTKTETELNAALAAAKGIVGSTDQSIVNSATTRLQNAITALRWADKKYPDPMDLPSQFTLPDPWTYFDGHKVTSANDWFGNGGRRQEILDMAQFYEYGYMPAPPDHISITNVTAVPASQGRPQGLNLNVSITYGSITAPMTFTLYPPTEQARQASGHMGPVPVVLSFGGYIAQYGDAGFAVLAVPTNVTTDDRNNPWGTRSGTFRTFFPYTRNGDTHEISNEMGGAWGASRAIDALELLAASGNIYGEGFGSLVAPNKLAVTGHSINGKYAFVSALFDKRIDVCIPSAAGATGPSPYRYVYIGHEYSWGKAAGTEMMGDTIRHNPGRTTELFRRFLTPGRFYERLDGAWGYGDRLPFDQHELVATLAPRAIVLHNTVNDYGDGAESDPLGLQAAKFVYNTLGFNADDLVKFNIRPLAPGDGHAEDEPQRKRTAEYLNHYFYHTEMSEATAEYLNDDPFDNEGTRAENAYNRYFGGYKTLAPWKDYTLPIVPSVTTSELSFGRTGAPYSQTLVATGDTPITWSLDSGTMPYGLSIDGATGIISGIPITPGTFSFNVKAQNIGGSAIKPLSIVIALSESSPSNYSPSSGSTGSSTGTSGASTASPSPINETDGDIIIKGNGAELTIPKLYFEAAADGIAPKTITSDLAAGTVTFSKEAIVEIAQQAGGNDIKLNMEVTKPDENGDVTYTLTMSTTDGKQITQFNDKLVTISVPYMLVEGRNPNAVIAKSKSDNAVLRGHYDPDAKRMIFTTRHFSDFLVTYNLVEFSDVPKTSKLYDPVVFLAARGITQGVGNDRFDLKSTLTRKEMLVSLMRIMDIAPDTTWTVNFADAGNDYATGYLAAAKRLGISTGNNADGTTFGGNLNVNVSEFYQFLYNALHNDLPASAPNAPALNSYTDYANIPTWAMEATKVFVSAGAALYENKITPNALLSRSDMAELFYKFLKK